MPEQTRKSFATTLPEPLIRRLQQESKRTGIPQSKLVEKALRDMLRRRKER